MGQQKALLGPRWTSNVFTED